MGDTDDEADDWAEVIAACGEIDICSLAAGVVSGGVIFESLSCSGASCSGNFFSVSHSG